MKPTIVYEKEAWEKIKFWVDRSPVEISGLGLVDVIDGNIIKVSHVFLLPQKNGPAHTDIEESDVAKAMHDYIDRPGTVRLWWHSHANMSVFWSGTDHDTIKKLGKGGWLVASVFNKKGEVKSAVHVEHGIQTPFGTDTLFIDDLETKQAFSVSGMLDWEKEYSENCKERPYVNHYKNSWWDNELQKEPNFPVLSNENEKENLLNFSGNKPTRPPGMSKKQFKKLRKLWVPEETTDVYGFTQSERTLFAQQGWTEDDLDFFIEKNDFTPSELLKLAADNVDALEIRYMLNSNYTPTDIMELQFSEQELDDDGVIQDKEVIQ